MNKLYRFTVCALLAHGASLFCWASSPAPYPVTVDSQRDTVSAITVFQANGYKVRATFTSGNTPDVITSENPFLWVYTNGVTNAVSVTGAWTVVNSASGLVDFVFSSASLNISTGIFPYQIGLDSVGGPTVYKQGSFQVKGSGASVGADVAFAMNPVNWGLITWTGLPDWIEDAPGTNGIFARQSNAWKNVESDLLAIYSISNGLDGRITTLETGKASLVTFAATNSGLQAQIDTKLPTATHASSTASLWSAIGAIVSADNALTNVVASGRLSSSKTGALAYISFDATGLATGTPIYSVSGLATGTPLYVETGTGTLIAASLTPYLTTASAAGTYATGTPLYVETGTGTLIAASLSGYATGTPLYVETGTGTLIAASISGFINSATASNSFYLASNPSNYQSGARVATNIAAQIATNGFITETSATGFVRKTGGTMTGDLNLGGFDIDGVARLDSFGGAFIVMDDGNFEISGDVYFQSNAFFNGGAQLVGYATTGALATATANMATSGQWNASVAGSSNLAFAIGVGATNGVNAVGLVATNLHLAQGVLLTNNTAAIASLTSGVLSVGAAATNAQVTASNAVPWLSLTGAVNAVGITNVSNQALAGGGRTNAIIAGTWTNSAYPWITNAAFVAGYDDSENIGASRAYVTVGRSKTSDTYRGFRYNRLSQFWEDIDYSGSATNRFLTTAVFSSSSYVQASEATNYVRMLIGKPTASTIGQFRDIYRETGGTSVWINVGNSTNWLRVNGVLNNFD